MLPDTLSFVDVLPVALVSFISDYLECRIIEIRTIEFYYITQAKASIKILISLHIYIHNDINSASLIQIAENKTKNKT
jgi:hypothetical protein